MKKTFKDFYEGQIYNNFKILSVYNDGKRYKINCICLNCGKEHTKRIDTIDKGCYCSFGIVDLENSISVTHPHLAKYIVDENYTKTRSFGSNIVTKVQCPICKYEKNTTANKLNSRGFICNNCGKGASMNEKCISSILSQLNIGFKKEARFEWCQNKYYDFYIPSKNMIIEVHGAQHYVQPSGSWGKLEDTLKNDNYKKQTAVDNGISIYLTIKSQSQDYKKIAKDITKEMSLYFNLNELNYNLLYENMFGSILYDIIDCWNEGLNISNISKKMDTNKTTVSKYLKIALENKLCDCTRQEIIKRGCLETSKKRKGVPLKYTVHNKKSIVVVETNEIFDSMTHLANESVRVFGKKICVATISKLIKNKKSLNGYSVEFV